MGVRIALMVLGVFAVAWSWAALGMSGAAPGLIVIPVAISAVLVGWGWRAAGTVPARGRHVGKVVGLWSGIEVVALLVTANLLENLHRADLMMPLGALIVGFHFFPLARGIPVRLYHATGAGLVSAGLIGLMVPAAERPIVVGISAAIVLWGTALAVVLRARQAGATA